MTEKEQELRAVISDLLHVIAEKNDQIEEQAKDIETLNSVSIEMARKGMAIRMELESAQKRIAELESELESAWLEYGRATSLAYALHS